MTRFEFALATPKDDAQLRQRMAADWMEGTISVSFRREPEYFAGSHVQGEFCQVIKCTDNQTGQIIGLGCRLIQKAFINGTPERLGLLADLRTDRNFRHGTLIGRGYRFLRNFHDADPVPLYYSVILDGNEAALNNLVGGRAGLPQYQDLGLILTPAIHLDFAKPEIKVAGVQFQRGKREHLADIVRFLQKWHSQKQFAPCYQLADFDSPRLKGLQPEDFYLAVKSDRIVGTVAAWNQRDFRQTHIEKYSPPLALARPFYNLLARLTPLKPLPNPGQAVPYFYLALAAVEENNPEIFRGLLRYLYCDRHTAPWHYFIAGLHEADPLAAILKEYRQIAAAGRLFAIYYPDGEAQFKQLDKRTPYIEMAAI